MAGVLLHDPAHARPFFSQHLRNGEHELVDRKALAVDDGGKHCPVPFPANLLHDRTRPATP
jgi:hypothetical protein